MSRLFAALVVLAAPAAARPADPTPEQLLSPTSHLFVRWDGVTAHADTYKKSFWGPLMAGPTGDTVRTLIAKVPKLLGESLLADPLLDGKPPAELKATLADLKNAAKITDLIADTGVVVAAEIREPRPTLKGLGAALGGLLGGDPPGLDVLMPDLHLLVVLPNAADRADVPFAALRLAWQAADHAVEPFAAAGRKGFRIAPAGPAGPRPGPVGPAGPQDRFGLSKIALQRDVDGPPAIKVESAWWVEGKHVVLYVGTAAPEKVVAEVGANPAKGGVTAHPLFVRCSAKPAFTSVARGFADAGRVVGLAKALAGPYVPGLGHRLDDLGVGNLKAVVFNAGYDGKEFRAVWDFDLPGERKGFAKVLKKDPIGLADLPPLPPDVTRFLAARVDPGAVYESGLALVEAFAGVGPDEDPRDRAAHTPAAIKARRAELAREFDKALGVSMADDLLPCLGDKLVIYQSPNEGLSIFGTVVCVSLKDPVKARAVADRLHPGIENLVGSPVRVRKKVLAGVEVRQLHSRNFGIVTPTYAVAGDWLVVALHPQGVQGLVLRAKGDLPAWKPDADTAARLAKLPKDGCVLQFCDPTTTVKNLCCLGPLFLGTLDNLSGLRRGDGDDRADFDPLDVGLVPNGHELSKHLFPNLTVTRDDGTTVRVEVNESLSVPLEVIGLEPFIFGTAVFGFRLF
ncbi:MAG: hypothetical protein C0501_25490 [Isosphaera sp.]|nr:hypothetical protein [Isosphaera sp.]